MGRGGQLTIRIGVLPKSADISTGGRPPNARYPDCALLLTAMLNTGETRPCLYMLVKTGSYLRWSGEPGYLEDLVEWLLKTWPVIGYPSPRIPLETPSPGMFVTSTRMLSCFFTVMPAIVISS